MNTLSRISSPFLLSLSLTVASHAATLDAKNNKQNHVNEPSPVVTNSLPNDPSFKPHHGIYEEIEKIQQSMQRLMNSHFSEMQKNLNNLPPHWSLNNLSNIQVEENKDKITYKIKLLKNPDNKVDVSVKHGQLIVTSNIEQKITTEENNNKSVQYSQNQSIQSFKIPPGYDAKSLKTELKKTSLIITLQKKHK